MGITAFELSERLLADSLSMCQIDDTLYLLELRSSCLNLYETLSQGVSKNGEEISEYGDEIQENLIELMFLKYPHSSTRNCTRSFPQWNSKS